jgi:hypothetical protein
MVVRSDFELDACLRDREFAGRGERQDDVNTKAGATVMS